MAKNRWVTGVITLYWYLLGARFVMVYNLETYLLPTFVWNIGECEKNIPVGSRVWKMGSVKIPSFINRINRSSTVWDDRHIWQMEAKKICEVHVVLLRGLLYITSIKG